MPFNESSYEQTRIMRDAVEMIYARGVLIAAAASALDASEEAIKKRVQRGRQLLAECLLAGPHS